LLKGVILLIFEKALQEPKYVCMYAQLCKKLSKKVPNFDKPTPDNTTTFRRLLLNKCQDEFENRARASAVFDKRTDKLTVEEEEEKLLAKRKMLGNINFIGELGKLEMLTHKILHQCCEELVKKTKAEDLECLCLLLSGCGQLLDNERGKKLMDQYFARILELSKNEKLPPRIRFMLQDVLELRQNHWHRRQTKSVKESPKPIEDIRKEASEELGLAMPDSENMDYRPVNLARLGRPKPFGSKKKTGMEDVFGPVPFAMTTLGTGPGVITPGEKPHGMEPNGFHQGPMNNYRPPGGIRAYNNNSNIMNGGGYYGQHQHPPQMRHGGRQNQHANQYDHYAHGNNQTRNNYNNMMNGFEKAPVAPRFQKQILTQPGIHGVSHHPQQPSTMPNEELSLRPPPNSMIKMFPQPHPKAFMSIGPDHRPLHPLPQAPGMKEIPAANKTSADKANASSKGEQGPSKADFLKKIEQVLEEYLNCKNEEEALQSLKEIKLPEKYLKDVAATILNKAMDRSDAERDLSYSLLMHLEKENFVSHTHFLESYQNILEQMGELEADIPRIKSYVAAFAAKSVSSGTLTLTEIAKPTEDGNHFPFLLLVLQQLGKTMEKNKVAKMLEESKIDLLNTLPKVDRTKTRMADILEERELSFLFPLLKIQAEMSQQLNANSSPDDFFTWIKNNVDSEHHAAPEFISALMTVLFRFITQEAAKGTDQSDKAVRDKEKELLLSFKHVITKFLRNKIDLQVIGIYALQSCWYASDCPKLALLRWFVSMYELEMIEEDAFLKWKEDLRDDYPGKGKALFQVNQWLLWLEQADDDEEDGDEQE